MYTSLEKDLLRFGDTIQMVGVIYHDPIDNKMIHLYFPDCPDCPPIDNTGGTIISLEDWNKLIIQLDQVNVQATRDNKMVMLRKCERQISANVSWKVFERDHYTCQYCGITGVPLTVDHIITWESGGPSIPENLLTSCKHCNRIRGNTPYAEWLKSDKYKKCSKNLSGATQLGNEQILTRLDKIPMLNHIKSR
jgi:5-methylcytosine-specific restriction endonuclease McrA